MKILGVSFGGRDGANDSMCKEALRGAKDAGADIEFVHILDWDIKNCTGCVTCSKSLVTGKGNLCVLKDEFDELLSMMLDADGIIFATPIFEKGATGLFHTITDRFGPRMDRGMNIVGTKISQERGGKIPDPRILKDKVVSFMGIGGSDWNTMIQFDCGMLALSPAWKIIDNECFPWSKNIIMEDEKVKKAYDIGTNLAKAAGNYENSGYMGGKGVCPHCHSNNFFLEPGSDKAICCLCGIIGTLEAKNGALEFVFPESQIEHAHDTIPGKLKHAQDIGENEGKNMEARASQEYKDRIQAYREFISPTQPSSKRA